MQRNQAIGLVLLALGVALMTMRGMPLTLLIIGLAPAVIGIALALVIMRIPRARETAEFINEPRPEGDPNTFGWTRIATLIAAGVAVTAWAAVIGIRSEVASLLIMPAVITFVIAGVAVFGAIRPQQFVGTMSWVLISAVGFTFAIPILVVWALAANEFGLDPTYGVMVSPVLLAIGLVSLKWPRGRTGDVNEPA
jgi:hypothetical protein